MFANNATECFDRMVPGVSSLVARKFGVAPSIMRCRNDITKNLKRNVRTGCGDLEESYKEHEGDDVLNGEVQGKGDVASLWCLMSHTILEAHTTLHKPITMVGATNSVVVQKNNDAFVDDTDGYAEEESRCDSAEEEAIRSLQEKAQSWAKLIAVLGGSIDFHKCIWQLIGWDYKVSPPRMK